MRFTLFSETSFDLIDPIATIEAYCFQSNFYLSYDLITNERNVNKIGARINASTLKECMKVIENTKDLDIFSYDLDKFLDVDEEKRNNYIYKFNEMAVKKLLTKGVGFSKTTKILHTFYPEIIPMIDSMLQSEYLRIGEKHSRKTWKKGDPEIFIDYYKNLKLDNNKKNLDELDGKLREKLPHLTKVRIFDILWWSYLKSEMIKLKAQYKYGKMIKWTTIGHFK
jgi:hypothetical protein